MFGWENKASLELPHSSRRESRPVYWFGDSMFFGQNKAGFCIRNCFTTRRCPPSLLSKVKICEAFAFWKEYWRCPSETRRQQREQALTYKLFILYQNRLCGKLWLMHSSGNGGWGMLNAHSHVLCIRCTYIYHATVAKSVRLSADRCSFHDIWRLDTRRVSLYRLNIECSHSLELAPCLITLYLVISS